jgi:hypothetical protein
MVLGRDDAFICRAKRSQQRDLTVLASYGSAARGDPLYEAMLQVSKLRIVFLCNYFVSKIPRLWRLNGSSEYRKTLLSQRTEWPLYSTGYRGARHFRA